MKYIPAKARDVSEIQIRVLAMNHLVEVFNY